MRAKTLNSSPVAPITPKMGTPVNSGVGYRAHAAAVVAALPTGRRHSCRPGGSDTDGIGAWVALGLVVGAIAVVLGCFLALSRHAPPVPGGGLLAAVPSDAAFDAAVRDAVADMRPYEPASDASATAEPESWAPTLIATAADPAIERLTAAVPPVHLRAATETAVSGLRRIGTQLDAYRVCRSKGGNCSTQRHALDQAVADAHRLLGDLSLYTFG